MHHEEIESTPLLQLKLLNEVEEVVGVLDQVRQTEQLDDRVDDPDQMVIHELQIMFNDYEPMVVELLARLEVADDPLHDELTDLEVQEVMEVQVLQILYQVQQQRIRVVVVVDIRHEGQEVQDDEEMVKHIDCQMEVLEQLIQDEEVEALLVLVQQLDIADDLEL